MHDALVVTGVDTTSKGVVPVGGVSDVSIACGNNAGVDTGGIGLPKVDVHVRNRLTGVHVNDLEINIKDDTLLIFGYVLPDQLSIDVCGSRNGYLALLFSAILRVMARTYSTARP